MYICNLAIWNTVEPVYNGSVYGGHPVYNGHWTTSQISSLIFSVRVQRGHFSTIVEWSFIEMWRWYWSRAVGDTTHTYYHLPKALAWKILPGTKVMPGFKFGGKHVINFQMAVEICFLLGKTIILLLSDRVLKYLFLSFAGLGLFFLNRELQSNLYITVTLKKWPSNHYIQGDCCTQVSFKLPSKSIKSLSNYK